MKKHYEPAIYLLLIIVWTYKGLDKLMRFKESRNAFHLTPSLSIWKGSLAVLIKML